MQQNELGKIISKARKEKGLSQRQLAKLANMDYSAISRIEKGERKKPNILNLKGIAEILDLSLVTLMQLAGYNDIEINHGQDLSNKRSISDYQNALEDYERFYFDILEDIESRRKNTFACKGAIYELIDKIEMANAKNQKISDNDIVEDLKNIVALLRPNLEKVDKSIYPKYDRALFKTNNETSTLKFNTFTGIYSSDLSEDKK